MDQQTPPGNSYELEWSSYELLDLKNVSAALDQRITQSQEHREKNKKEFEEILSKFGQLLAEKTKTKLDAFKQLIEQEQQENKKIIERLGNLEKGQLQQKNALPSMLNWSAGTTIATALFMLLLYYSNKTYNFYDKLDSLIASR